MKLLPLLQWSTQEIEAYIDDHNLPRHPLQKQGYVSVGDWHSSRPKSADDQDERAGRFHRVDSQECGLHTDGVSIPAPTPQPQQEPECSLAAAGVEMSPNGA